MSGFCSLLRSIRNSLKIAFFGVFRVFAKKAPKKVQKNITFFWLIFRGLTRMSKKTCKKSCSEIWIVSENPLPLHSLSEMRAFSSAGSEHLPYKQRVGGSNPSTPTKLSFQGSLAQLNRAFDYGSKGYRFESYASHERCGEGYIPEWPNGADCKSAGFRLRWFESICTHSKS